MVDTIYINFLCRRKITRGEEKERLRKLVLERLNFITDTERNDLNRGGIGR